MSFTSEQVAKLTKLIQEGVQIKREVDDLNVGLKETVAAIAEEMGIKPSILSRTINKVFKGDFEEDQANLESVEELLIVTKNRS